MDVEYHFDYDELYRLLLDASRTAFRDFQQAHSSETFYSFVLLTDAERLGVSATGATEEYLIKISYDYFTKHPEWYENIGIEEVQRNFRHGFDGYVFPFEELSSSVDQIMISRHEALKDVYDKIVDADSESDDVERSERVDRAWKAIEGGYATFDQACTTLLRELNTGWSEREDAAWQAVEPHYDKFDQTCIAVLRQLDSEGVFGAGNARLNVVVNFVIADDIWDHELLLKNAESLNPPEVLKRYREELSAAAKVEARISENTERRRQNRREQKKLRDTNSTSDS